MDTQDIERALMAAKASHLTDDELDKYRVDELDKIVMLRATAHLEECLICRERLLFLQEEQAALQGGEEVTAEDIALMRRLLAKHDAVEKNEELQTGPNLLRRLRKRLDSFVDSISYPVGLQLQPGTAAFSTSPEVVEVESEDQRFAISVFEDENQNMIINLDAEAVELEGTAIHLAAGKWERTVRLQRIDDDYVGAEVVITEEERKQIPIDITLQLRVEQEKE